MPNQDETPLYKKVKVRVNLSGARYIGYVRVYPPKTRVSDVLNEQKPFVTLSEVDAVDPVAKGAELVVNKGLISYVQVIEEFKRTYRGVHSGDFVKTKILTVDFQIVGEIFLATHMTMADRAELLNGIPHFLNVRDAGIVGTKEQYDFLAVSVHQIRSLEIGV